VQPGPIDTDANPENGPMKDLMHSFMALSAMDGQRKWLAWSLGFQGLKPVL
jgi:hypothetical protein